MTMPTLGLFATLAGWVLVAAAVYVFWRRSYRAKPQKEAMKGLYKVRAPLAAALALLLVGMFVWAWPQMPYRHGAHLKPATHIVRVNALMWGWEFTVDGGPAAQDGDTVILPAGDVEFQVTAPLGVDTNVNHGFGLYDAANTLVVQTQAMPSKTNVLRATLKPGAYEVLCMEFCGLEHHHMIASIKVKGESK